MRIPSYTARPRFYVAHSETEAFSSWGTMQEAIDCIARFKLNAPENHSRIIGVVRVSGTQHILLHPPAGDSAVAAALHASHAQGPPVTEYERIEGYQPFGVATPQQLSSEEARAVRPEADELLALIGDKKRAIQTLMGKIHEHQRRLEAIAVEAFNELSEPIDGMTLEEGDMVIGYRPCAESPIHVCCYSNEVVSLPGQRAHERWRTEHAGTREEHLYPDIPTAHTDACLFCGTRQEEDHGEDPKQLEGSAAATVGSAGTTGSHGRGVIS